MSIQRQFNRHGREGTITHGGKSEFLNKFNESLTGGYFLHATKGWRHRSEKSGKAAIITHRVKVGLFPPPILSWRNIKSLLTSKDSA